MNTSALLHALTWVFSPFPLLAASLGLFLAALGPWVLLRRRDPPLLLLVAVGLCGGVALILGENGHHGVHWDLLSDALWTSGAMWLLLSVIWGLSVLVQPAEQGEPRPASDRLRLLRWFLPTLACVALASALLASLSGVFAAFLGLPLLVSSLLPLYDTERVRHVRRSIAWLQLSAAGIVAVAHGPSLLWFFLTKPPLLPQFLLLFVFPLLWGLLAPLPVAVLWALGPRVRGAGWIVGMLVAASLLGVGRAEWLTRTERALLRLDLSDLPTRASRANLAPQGDICIETPSSRCPEGEVPLWVWPADVPIGDRVLGRKGGVLVSSESTGLGTVYFGVGSPDGPSAVRLGEGAYRIAGKRVVGLQDALSAVEEAQDACRSFLTFEPDPGWTAQELVTLCEHGCTYEPGPHRCEWDEVLGWVTRCEPSEVCTILDGTVGTCEQGGCTVNGGGKVVELSCRGGGCTVSDAAAVKCTEGDCTTRP